MRDICVWGGAGFIGSVLIGRLLDRGYNVTVVDNLHKGGDSLLQYVNNKNFHFERADISQESQVKKVHEKDYEGIILLSGIVGLPACKKHPSLAKAVNEDGWANVAKYKGRAKLVAAGTGSVYGIVKDEICTENTSTNPQSLYGITKLNGEKAILNYLNTVVLRFATCIGVSPSMRLDLLPNYMCYEAVINRFLSVFESGNMRTFIDIRDFADSLIFILENFDNLKYRVYNVGTEKNNWTKRQLAEYIGEKTGCMIAYAETHKDEDARDYACDYSRIHEAGFNVKYSMEETIMDLIKSVPLLDTQNKYKKW